MEIYSVASGKMVGLDQVADPVFSERMAGDGIGVIPDSNLICSPVEGEVRMVFPTRHAIGIRGDEDTDILIHIGIDTVELNGKPFVAKVKEGDRVRIEDPLMEADFEAIREAGYDPTVLLLVANKKVRVMKDSGNVETGEYVLETE